MRIVGWILSLAFLSTALAGCANNPFSSTANKGAQDRLAQLETKNRELESRASTLDLDNQELHTQIARTQQQSKLLEDQLLATREQLSSVGTQLTQTQGDKDRNEKELEALAAAAKHRGSATITANSSFQRTLPAISLPGVQVRQDGDCVRIELPANRLFNPSSVTLQPAAAALIDSVAVEVARTYPEQLIGVEGHTDAEGARGTTATAAQQLAVSRSLSVYQYLASKGQLQQGQMFVVGHGGNHPVVSNATASGRERNNRVELVIYPEKRH